MKMPRLAFQRLKLFTIWYISSDVAAGLARLPVFSAVLNAAATAASMAGLSNVRPFAAVIVLFQAGGSLKPSFSLPESVRRSPSRFNSRPAPVCDSISTFCEASSSASEKRSAFAAGGHGRLAFSPGTTTDFGSAPETAPACFLASSK